MSLEPNPTWYKDALIYEMHVRSFFDSNDDGIGDFRGVTQKLDYLQDLGVTALWLLPFYPSPLKDDGYDIADYRSINPDYGTMDDFQEFLHEAHRRGLRVITELVINHTSDQHPWFQRARRAPKGSPEREFYVWSDTVERYKDTRIIFPDFESSNWAWDAVAKQYYWHRYYSHQPDLNFDNPRVHEQVFDILDFWLEMGVDGLRLDAIPQLYEREGTNNENLPETHEFLRKLRRHVDENYDDRMLLAEANQWPEGAAEYFGDGDECHMNFHFPLMPRLYLAVDRGDRFPIVDILEQMPDIPEGCAWATFLRNHDELTLEMVTDEERDYMYRRFAKHQRARINVGIRRRLAPLMGNDRPKIELMHALLFALPGTPVLYYGDEIGMGDNFFLGDRNGVRTPMQWSDDRNAGFSRANPQQLFLPVVSDPEYHYEAVNVQIQQANGSSLLWAIKRLIALRNRHPALGTGDLEFLRPENRKILAFVRSTADEQVLFAANLSRYPQAFELDLSTYRGQTVRELSGYSEFPDVGEGSYPLTLGGHSFMFFELVGEQRSQTVAGADETLPGIELTGDDPWTELVEGSARPRLESVISESMTAHGWFHRERRHVSSVRMEACVTPDEPEMSARIVIVEVRFADREPERYALPLALVPAEETEQTASRAVVYARVRDRGVDRLLVDGLWFTPLSRRLLSLACTGGELGHGTLTLSGEPTGKSAKSTQPTPRFLGAEQSSTSVAFGDEWVLKFHPRIETGPNPEAEICRHLTDAGFEHGPTLGGVLQLVEDGRQQATLAVAQRFVPNEGQAWDNVLDDLDLYLERVLAAEATTDPIVSESAGVAIPFRHAAAQIGRRTAQLHRVLGDSDDQRFAPERFSSHYRRGLYQSMRNLWGEVRDELRRCSRDDEVPDETRNLARVVLEQAPALLGRFDPLRERPFDGARIRIHGDLHLKRFLSTGKDFVVTGFEGDPSRAAGERRIKRSPLRDVASMLRSFRYAIHAAMSRLHDQGIVPESPPRPALIEAARTWEMSVRDDFLTAYLEEVADLRGTLLPGDDEDLHDLLEVFVLARAVYEIGYELDADRGFAAPAMRDTLTMLSSEN